MPIAYPYAINDRGETARASGDERIRGLIEQVLFTAPGERINRPDFGCNLRGLMFSPLNAATPGTAQLLVQAALEEWLADFIRVQKVQIEVDESSVTVLVQYLALRSGRVEAARFSRKV